MSVAFGILIIYIACSSLQTAILYGLGGGDVNIDHCIRQGFSVWAIIGAFVFVVYAGIQFIIGVWHV